jgi:hypothetical protein
MEAEQNRRQHLQVQSQTAMELDIDVPQQIENEETSCNVSAATSTGAESSNLTMMHSETHSLNREDSDEKADDCNVDTCSSSTQPVESQDIGVEPSCAYALEPASSTNREGLQEGEQEVACLSTENQFNQSSDVGILLEKEEIEDSEMKNSHQENVQVETSELDSSECLTVTAEGTSGGTILDKPNFCDSEKIDLDTGCQRDVPIASSNINDEEERQYDVLGFRDNEVEYMTEEDIARNEYESEKVLIEASKKCVNEFVDLSNAEPDRPSDERQAKPIDASHIYSESLPDMKDDIKSGSQETLTDSGGIIPETIRGFKRQDPAFGLAKPDLPTLQSIDCNGRDEVL